MGAAAGLGLLVASAVAADKEAPKAEGELKDLTSKVSYSIGLDLGKKLKAQSVDLKPELIAQGIKDALEGKAQLTDEQIREAMLEFQKVMVSKLDAAAEQHKKEGAEFLATNKKKPGVKTTASGLQYQVVREGKGEAPRATDTVTVNYEGRLIDGTVFDSSYKRGQPATFPVSGVIKGWTEALQLMKVGAKWKLFIPSELAYGANPRAGGIIRPNDTLVFDVELLKIGGE